MKVYYNICASSTCNCEKTPKNAVWTWAMSDFAYTQKRRTMFSQSGLQPRNRDGIASFVWLSPLAYDKIHHVIIDWASMVVNIDNVS